MTQKPFTVIAGFLGAGKTTLVNHILTQAGGTRFAVLVNDFGAVNIDADLIAAHDGQTMALTNGCICCSLSDGFIQTMLRLMAAPERFDHVIVEASGVSEPDRIMDFARLDPELSPDAIVTLVDAETICDRLADPLIADIVATQIGCGDLLVLNKTDLAGDVAEARSKIRQIAPETAVLDCAQARISLEVILGLERMERPASGSALANPFWTGHCSADKPIDREMFEAAAAALPPSVLRGKGRVSFSGGETAHVWQRVGGRNTLTATDDPAGPSQIVLIGTGSSDAPQPFYQVYQVFRTRTGA